MRVLDDRNVAARVKKALLQNTESSGLDVYVECQDGVVQLSGILRQAEEVEG